MNSMTHQLFHSFSWVRDIYFPEGSTVPPGSKIQTSSNSGYSVYIHYPVDGGGWQSKAYSHGDTGISILDDGIWLSEDSLERNKYIFDMGFILTKNGFKRE